MYEELVNEIIEGRRLGKEDDLTFLIDGDLESLCQGADKIRKELCGNQVDLCTIINGRAGRCSENCRFCAQSSHHHTGAEEYDVMDVDSFVKACHVNEENGAHRFSIVTAGRTLVGKEFDQIVSDAHKKAGQIIDTSKKEAALQKEKVMNKAEQEIRGMILEAAVKSMQSEHNDEALYDEFLTKAGESTHEES